MTKTNVLLDKNVITRICNRLLNATYIDVYAIGIDDIIWKQLVYRLQSLGLLTTLHDTFNQKYVIMWLTTGVLLRFRTGGESPLLRLANKIT